MSVVIIVLYLQFVKYFALEISLLVSFICHERTLMLLVQHGSQLPHIGSLNNSDKMIILLHGILNKVDTNDCAFVHHT